MMSITRDPLAARENLGVPERVESTRSLIPDSLATMTAHTPARRIGRFNHHQPPATTTADDLARCQRHDHQDVPSALPGPHGPQGLLGGGSPPRSTARSGPSPSVTASPTYPSVRPVDTDDHSPDGAIAPIEPDQIRGSVASPPTCSCWSRRRKPQFAIARMNTARLRFDLDRRAWLAAAFAWKRSRGERRPRQP
jgi:hypothetical protein